MRNELQHKDDRPAEPVRSRLRKKPEPTTSKRKEAKKKQPKKAKKDAPKPPSPRPEEVDDDGGNINVADKRKAVDEEDDLPSRKRSRRGSIPAASPLSTRPYQPRTNCDLRWMRRAKRQLEKSSPNARTIHATNIAGMRSFFENIRAPDEIQYEYDNSNLSSGDDDSLTENEIVGPQCYILSTLAARQLLNSSDEISGPVFVTDTRSLLVEDEIDPRRPIDKVFDWFTDPSGTFVCVDSSRIPTAKEHQVRLREARSRFTGNYDPKKTVKHPWNLPDMPFPFQNNGAPAFVQVPNANLLVDIMRWQLDVTPDQVCFSSCGEERSYEHAACGYDHTTPTPEPQEPPSKRNVGFEKTSKTAAKAPSKAEASPEKMQHFITDKALASLQADWRAWQGTVMLAEAGAITLPHADRWSFATWIHCQEGEIGLAWQDNPTRKERSEALANDSKAVGTWLLRILRKGDAVYLSPGTPHLVFRRTDKGQTFALAGHVLRRCDVERWLSLLYLEVGQYIKDKEDEVPRGDTVRGLIDGTRHMLEQAKESGTIELYGDEGVIERVQRLIVELEKRAKALDAKTAP